MDNRLGGVGNRSPHFAGGIPWPLPGCSLRLRIVLDSLVDDGGSVHRLLPGVENHRPGGASMNLAAGLVYGFVLGVCMFVTLCLGVRTLLLKAKGPAWFSAFHTLRMVCWFLGFWAFSHLGAGGLLAGLAGVLLARRLAFWHWGS